MTVADHHEIERTFALGRTDAAPLDVLAAVPGVADVVEPVTAELEATYVDTDDLALVRAGVTLRRRTGGADAGWHLKVPSGQGRDEIHRPLGEDAGAVPADLRERVEPWSGGRALAGVAVVRTHRTTYDLLDAEGAPLAEVADDVVTGEPLDGGPTTAWRELEVELTGGDVPLLDAATEALAAAGIEVSTQPRKIEAVLAHRLLDDEAVGSDED